MKTDRNILVAFILNAGFSIIELIGGILTNSVAIISDAVHDFGDAIGIGISYILEKISKKKPNNKYTYGYMRYSILGSLITTLILCIGSLLVMIGAIYRIFNPVEINYNGMIVFAILGVSINFLAAYCTKNGDSLNQKAVNLHMLEDVLGWVVVLIGSILMKITDITVIDSIMSIGVATFILINAFKNLLKILDVFLEKTPKNIDIEKLKLHILNIEGLIDIHHLHIWSMDGYHNFATLHVVSDKDEEKIKNKVKTELMEHGIKHVTIEMETSKTKCEEKECSNKIEMHHHHHHH